MSARLSLLTLALVLSAASSSSDPYGNEACLGGMVRLPGPACTLPPAPNISLDGDARDWQLPRLEEVLVPGSCCATGDSGLTHAAREADTGNLIFFNHTVGLPAPESNRVYALVFSRADMDGDDPGNIHTQLLAHGNGLVEQFVNGERVFGAAVDANFGVQGIEWRVPPSVLPYPGVANVSAVTYELEGDLFVPRDTNGEVAKICWDPESELDACVK